jgi:ferrous iron transport protein A
MEIGFLPGESVRIVATGFPAGDPLAVRIGQATFALRRHEAALVRVSWRLQHEATPQNARRHGQPT